MSASAQAAAEAKSRRLDSVAFYYDGATLPEEFRAFDAVVVEPDHGLDPRAWQHPSSRLYAYVSVGEVRGSRPYAAHMPERWKLGINPHWGSIVIDQAQPEWPAFFADKVVGPLWNAGYRGVFLDALDSYHHADPSVDIAAQQRGTVALIRMLKQRYPELRIIVNRGFEILGEVHGDIDAVVAESLFRSWDSTGGRYTEVGEADRTWLLERLRTARDRYGLPVAVIDYVPPADRALARATAERIRQLGFVPWVAADGLGNLGIGAVEVMPRRVLVLHDSREVPAGVNYADAHRFIEMPLNHLGYVAEHLDIRRDPLPAGMLLGRYAGIVTWFNGGIEGREMALSRWLRKQIAWGTPVAAFGQLGIAADSAAMGSLGLERAAAPAPGKLRVTGNPRMMGFEVAPEPDRTLLTPLRAAAAGTTALLEVADSQDNRYTGAAITPWGGFVLNPFAVTGVPGTDQSRWVVDPFAFLKAALRLPAIPVPDTTTENGRRLFVAHIDGDGFPSKAELPGTPLAGEVLLNEVLSRHRLPTAVSVIESEVSPDGLFPAVSQQTESAARRIFALPHVEIASHTYSHPFRWAHGGTKEDPGLGEVRPYGLDIPGYRMDPKREVLGSVDYIRQRLAPTGKPVRLFFWSGDAAPDSATLRLASEAGLYNLNGGLTAITRANPTLTAVHPLGLGKGGAFQVYAPVTNENIYTGLWNGPFYGFERVVETWQLTESPRRLKPVGLYYHAYSATKTASLTALRSAYQWAERQPLHPVFASEYVRKVLDFNRMVVAKGPDGWRIRGDGNLRTVRLPEELGTPDMRASRDVAGYSPGAEGRYVHLAGGDALLRTQSQRPTAAPRLAYANGRLERWEAGEAGVTLALTAHVPLEFGLAGARGCRVSVDGRPLVAARTESDVQSYRLNHAAAKVEVSCRGA